jgi:hypothetical protein
MQVFFIVHWVTFFKLLSLESVFVFGPFSLKLLSSDPILYFIHISTFKFEKRERVVGK